MSYAITKQSMASTIRSKHRLSEISHHFLSDENERSPTWKNTTTIPVLLGSKHDDYIVYELNRAFNQKDSSSMVLNIENHLPASGLLPQETTHEEAAMPDLCLVPITSPPTTLALKSDRFIIAVHSSLRGVRVAYDQLAFMASLETDFNVCVIMLDAKNIQEGKRFFRFLCDNAQSLLALELECGGLLLKKQQTTSNENQETEKYWNKKPVATDLNSVAEGILQTFTADVKRTLPIPISAPTRPTGLLS